MNRFGFVRWWLCVAALLTWPCKSVEAANCPAVGAAADALRYLRDQQGAKPRATAECFALSISQVPEAASGAEGDTWRRYLWEGSDFLRRFYTSATATAETRRFYADAELKAQAAYRARVLTRLEAGDGLQASKVEELRRDYARSVNAQSDVIWLVAGQSDKGLLELHRFLSDLDPAYLLDQTAVRWVEAARSCPNWVPVAVKPLPDYANTWCKADCSDHLETLTTKLASWWGKAPNPELTSFKRLTRMRADVSKLCGG